MNQVHLHLLINHLPIFGTILGALVLAYGLKTKSHETIIAAYGVLIIAAIGGVIAYLTGDGAAHALKQIAGIERGSIREHEDAAQFAYIISMIVGIAAIVGLVLTYKKSLWANKLAAIILFLSLFSFSVEARTGYLGGLIRHQSEINSDTNVQTPSSIKE